MAAHPTYFMLGQDSFRGDLSEDWVTNNADARWTGAESVVDIYNWNSAAVDTYDTTPTTAVSNTQSTSDLATIAMDVSLARHMLDNKHSDGIALIKRTDQGAVGGSGGSRWGKTHAESYPNIATAHTAMNTLITGRGDTMDVKGFFLSVGYAEGVAADSATDDAFLVDLTQFILDLRTDYGSATTPVVLDLPPASFSGSSASQNTSLENARAVIKQVAQADANVSFISGDDLERSNGSTKWYYTGEATIAQGTAMAKEMLRLVDGKGSTTSLGAPVYAIFGDDNCVGTSPITFLTQGGDEDYSNVSQTVKTWNWANSAWEPLSPHTSNTSTDGTTDFGPDISMGAALSAQHPGETVYIFKLGRLTSSVGNASSTGGSWPAHWADIYSEVVTAWDLAKTAMVTTELKVPDVRGVAFLFGSGGEDVNTQALADAFAGNVTDLIADYRAIFQTRTTGGDLASVVVRMQDTGEYNADYVDTVRVATATVEEQVPGVLAVDIDAARTNSDNKTLAGGGSLVAGELIAAGFATLNT